MKNKLFDTPPKRTISSLVAHASLSLLVFLFLFVIPISASAQNRDHDHRDNVCKLALNKVIIMKNMTDEKYICNSHPNGDVCGWICTVKSDQKSP